MTRNRDAEVARRNRQELIAAKLGRRDLMKLGLLTASGLLVAKRGLSARVAGATSSPPTTPFIAPLPIPPVLEPQASMTPAPRAPPNPGAGEARLAVHQRWDEFLPKELYEVHAREAQHSFHPELPLNTVWGYDGIVPGPTYHATYGQPVLVRMHNELPPDHVGFGIPQITTHLHNGHTPSESDGFPADFFDSGFFYDQHYPNVCAGFDASPPSGDVRETMNTLWYHDHRFDFTAQNVYKGLAGFYLLFDEVDSGDETDPNPRALRLPSGEFDVPLMFADKVFDADGQVFFDFFNFDGILGDKFIVNGAIQPFFKVARRKYRFRLLNTGPSRFYEFFLSNGQPFVQISNDGNLLPQPLPRTSVRLGVAERADVVVDFSHLRIGDRVFLENRLEQTSGRGPTGKILPQSSATQLLRFDVDRNPSEPDPSRVPPTLRALPTIDMREVVATRTWRFERKNGAWAINGKFFNVNEVRATPRRGTAEVWVLQNNSGDWQHPIHIHFEEHRILSRNGAAPPPEEVSRKDVVRLQGNEEVRIFLRFRDFLGRYPMHCHNVVHEDHAMMLRWDIVP